MGSDSQSSMEYRAGGGGSSDIPPFNILKKFSFRFISFMFSCPTPKTYAGVDTSNLVQTKNP